MPVRIVSHRFKIVSRCFVNRQYSATALYLNRTPRTTQSWCILRHNHGHSYQTIIFIYFTIGDGRMVLGIRKVDTYIPTLRFFFLFRTEPTRIRLKTPRILLQRATILRTLQPRLWLARSEPTKSIFLHFCYLPVDFNPHVLSMAFKPLKNTDLQRDVFWLHGDLLAALPLEDEAMMCVYYYSVDSSFHCYFHQRDFLCSFSQPPTWPPVPYNYGSY